MIDKITDRSMKSQYRNSEEKVNLKMERYILTVGHFMSGKMEDERPYDFGYRREKPDTPWDLKYDPPSRRSQSYTTLEFAERVLSYL